MYVRIRRKAIKISSILVMYPLVDVNFVPWDCESCPLKQGHKLLCRSLAASAINFLQPIDPYDL